MSLRLSECQRILAEISLDVSDVKRNLTNPTQGRINNTLEALKRIQKRGVADLNSMRPIPECYQFLYQINQLVGQMREYISKTPLNPSNLEAFQSIGIRAEQLEQEIDVYTDQLGLAVQEAQAYQQQQQQQQHQQQHQQQQKPQDLSSAFGQMGLGDGYQNGYADGFNQALDYNKLTIGQIKNLLDNVGTSLTGNKTQLLNQLLGNFVSQNLRTPTAAAAAAAPANGYRTQSPRSTRKQSRSRTPTHYLQGYQDGYVHALDYTKMRMSELKDLLRDRGLRSGGTKDELIQRLQGGYVSERVEKG